MKLYDELVARGLIAQVTDEENVSNLINEGKATFYIGFDPTADSLHVGHFMAFTSELSFAPFSHLFPEMNLFPFSNVLIVNKHLFSQPLQRTCN